LFGTLLKALAGVGLGLLIDYVAYKLSGMVTQLRTQILPGFNVDDALAMIIALVGFLFSPRFKELFAIAFATIVAIEAYEMLIKYGILNYQIAPDQPAGV